MSYNQIGHVVRRNEESLREEVVKRLNELYSSFVLFDILRRKDVIKNLNIIINLLVSY